MGQRRLTMAAAGAGLAVGVLLVGVLLPTVVDGEPPTRGIAASDEGSFTDDPRPGGDSVGEAPPPVDGTSVAGEDPGSDAGPGGGPGGGPSGGPGTASGGESRPSDAASTSGKRTASDRGITPDVIKLGIVLLDLSTANAVGLAPDHYEVETQRKAYQAQVDALNRAGGLHGRRTEAVYAVADPFDRSAAQEACVELTEDHKVFVVIAFAGYTADGMLCVGREHETPIIVFGWPPTEHFELTGGRLVSDGMAGNRIMFNWIHELHRLKLLAGKKIGIVGDESTANGDRQAVEQGLLPALGKYGYEVTYRARLSEDQPTAASQIPVQVGQMRSRGVDTVLLPTSFLYATQWVQAAHSQGWTPEYHVSDLQGLTSDAVVINMPASFDGAHGFTSNHFVRGAREGMPEPEIDRNCRITYNEAYGESWKWGDRHPLFNACVQVEIYRRSMLAAGPNPTRAAWTARIRTIGSFPLANQFPGGFAGKTDYGDSLATIRWGAACKCYRTIEGPRRAAY